MSTHVHQRDYVGGILGHDLEELFLPLGFAMDLKNPDLLLDHPNG
jgi:hypothetical protein